MKKMRPGKWTKSTKCSGGQCVEVMQASGGVFVRGIDRNKEIFFTKDEWQAFTKGVRNDEFEV